MHVVGYSYTTIHKHTTPQIVNMSDQDGVHRPYCEEAHRLFTDALKYSGDASIKIKGFLHRSHRDVVAYAKGLGFKPRDGCIPIKALLTRDNPYCWSIQFEILAEETKKLTLFLRDGNKRKELCLPNNDEELWKEMPVNFYRKANYLSLTTEFNDTTFDLFYYYTYAYLNSITIHIHYCSSVKRVGKYELEHEFGVIKLNTGCEKTVNLFYFGPKSISVLDPL